MYILPKPDKDQMHIMGIIGFQQFFEKQSIFAIQYEMLKEQKWFSFSSWGNNLWMIIRALQQLSRIETHKKFNGKTFDWSCLKADPW